MDDKESGSIWQENAALREAALGYVTQARQMAADGLKIAPLNKGVRAEAALAFAMIGDDASAELLARGLGKDYPQDTQMLSLWLPAIQAQVALNRRDPIQALNQLQTAMLPIEYGQIPFTANISCLYPTYVRGGAYLAAGQGNKAAVEFQKILDHSGIVWNCWTGALARLGLARAYALDAAKDPDARGKARTAYENFLTLWKNADPDVPIYKQAKAEYARLQ